MILLPKVAYYAMWDGHGENFMVPCAASKGAKASLPSGSCTSAPKRGTEAPDHSLEWTPTASLQQWDWQPNLLWHAFNVPNSPCSISCDSRSSSLDATVSPLMLSLLEQLQSDALCGSVIASDHLKVPPVGGTRISS